MTPSVPAGARADGADSAHQPHSVQAPVAIT